MTIPTSVFLSKLNAAGYAFFSGVPCSNFGDLFDRVAEAPEFVTVPAANEGSALSIAAGAVLSGRKSLVALQNSGLGNIINPLTSLLMVNEIPVLLLISVRGHPREPADEPQHTIMGANTSAFLDQLSIEWCEFDGTEAGLDCAIAGSNDAFRRTAPFAILFRKGQLSESSEAAVPPPLKADYILSVGQAIELVCDHLEPDDLVVSTTGYISRELFRVRDRPQNFYMQGSLGHCSAVAAGIALACPSRRVVALDGDGGVLMHMGVLSTIAHTRPRNLIHVALDNEGYVSTGGQASTSRTSSLDMVASACGYQTATRSLGAEELSKTLGRCTREEGPHFLLCKVNRSHPSRLARVTTRHSPKQNKEVFQQELGVQVSRPAPPGQTGVGI